ncbi:unnamed protein product, partial [Rotaria magnacalcarata]
LRVIKAFQDSIDRQPPEYATLDRLRAATVPKLSSFYNGNRPLTRPHSLNPIITINATVTDNHQPSRPTIEHTQLQTMNK